jgi:hypothetical protein|nr:MAG TPA: hypothetical protein [Caudoviricetes sp.]
MEKTFTKEEMFNVIIGFYEVMNYIYSARMEWYQGVGEMDKAISDIRHLVENHYDGDQEQGDTYAKVLYEVSKERRRNKDMQELFLPVYNVYKEDYPLIKAIEDMIKYKEIMDNGRTYTPKVLDEKLLSKILKESE